MGAGTQSAKLQILLIEDDEDDFVLVRDLIRQLPMTTDLCWERDFEGGLRALVNGGFDVCLLDYRLGAKTGLEVLARSRENACPTPIILLTGVAGEEVDLLAGEGGAADFLLKEEVSARQLERTIRYARERARQAELARRSEAELRLVIESVPACLLIRKEDKIIYANPAARSLLGYADTDGLIGTPVIQIVHPTDREAALETLRGGEAGAGGAGTRWRCLRRDGGDVLIEASATHLPVVFGGEKAFLMAFRDVTAERRAQELLESQAESLRALSLTDELTALNNRRGFLLFGGAQVRASHRSRQPVRVLFFDLDGLKEINDRFGHDAGDASIAAVATILRGTCREADVLGRLGGDEFIALLVDCVDPKPFLKRLYGNISNWNGNSGGHYQVSLSVGVASFDPGNPEPLEVLIQRADAAMYEEKRAKRLRPPR